jgi:1,4-alpha-glucan branching enzyme
MEHIEWSRNANIYEVNIRQYTAEGTINAFRKHLARLREMAVDIIWIMPVQPIGKKNRKGSLGSYYSISDYQAVNHEFGTLDDFREMVREAHQLGMYVLLDWVANHSAWDNIWTESNPDFYQRDDEGHFISPWDWTDVIAFDYSNPEMRTAMIDSMLFWLKETGIDGFRCDMAGMVPVDFWNEARKALEKNRKLFMLAEDEEVVALLDQAFDMNFTWEMHHLMNDVAIGKQNATAIWKKYLSYLERYPSNAYRMYFTSNHDENSHSGTAIERMGSAARAFAVLTYVLPGMPLTYSGQETATDKRLAFFEKDEIDWSEIPYSDFYRKLNLAKQQNESLWCADYGGDMVDINKGQNEQLFAVKREKGDNIVLAVLNLSNADQQLKMTHDRLAGSYTDIFTNEQYFPSVGFTFDLKPWEYLVLANKK